MKLSHIFLGSTMGALIVVSGPANGQTSGLDEIIVTAQKREESSQKVPLAIDVVAADMLIREGIRDMSDISKATTEIEANVRAGGQNITVGMRGMQQAGSSPMTDGLVAVHVDGGYLQSTWGLSGLMFDLDRVEAVSGPQGTLYGRNATAGALNLITKRPGRELEGNASVEYGNYNAFRVIAGVSVPLTDTFSARLAALRYTRDALYTDGSAAQDQWGTRLNTVWTPTDRDELFLSFDYSEFDSTPESGTLIALAPGATNPGGRYVVPKDPYDNLPYQGPAGRNLVYTGNLSGGQVLWGALGQYTHTFESFSATLQYAHRVLDTFSHGANRSLTTFSDTLNVIKTNSDSVELRFTSTGTGPFEWVGGLFYFEGSNVSFRGAPIGPNAGRLIGATTPAPAAGVPVNPSYPLDACPCTGNARSPANGDMESYAVFGQTTWTPASMARWHYTLGLRYSHDWKNADIGTTSGTPNFDGDGAGPLPPGYISRFISNGKSWDGIQYKLGAQYDVSDASMVYASIATGYKSGGFAYGSTPELKPEEVVSFEVGTKNRFLANTLQVNAAAWIYKYTDLESPVPRAIPPVVSPTGAIITTTNSVASLGEARLAGASVDVDWAVTDSDQLGLSATYVYSKVIDGTEITPTGQRSAVYYEGARLGDTPEFIVLGRYGHTFALANGARLNPQLKYQWQSEKYDGATINFATALQPAHPLSREFTTIPAQGILDASLRFTPQSGTWDITAYVNNVMDETDIKLITYNDAITAPLGATYGHVTATLGDPRTWGVILGMRF